MTEKQQQKWQKIRVQAAQLSLMANKLLNLVQDPVQVIIKLAATLNGDCTRYRIDLTNNTEEIKMVLAKFQDEINLAKKGYATAPEIFKNKASKLGYDINRYIDSKRNHIPQPNEDTIIYKIIFSMSDYIYALSKANYVRKTYSPKSLNRRYSRREKYYLEKYNNDTTNKNFQDSIDYVLRCIDCYIQQEKGFIELLLKIV